MPQEVEVVELTRAEFDALLEYSCTVPTGTTIGKRWKKNADAYQGQHTILSKAVEDITGLPQNWWMGEFVEDPDPKMIGIKWRKIQLKEGT